MAFTGWSDRALVFYEGLEADNSKTYWTANKATFDAEVHAPMVALLEELEPEFGAGRIARPYRDVRFSKDKSPYKTGLYATLGRGGYVSISADGLVAGIGYYVLAPDQLDRYRGAVDAERAGAELATVVSGLERRRIEVAGRSSLQRPPRGYAKDHPRADLLRHKGLIAWRRWPVAAWLHTRGAKTRIVEFLRTAAPLHAWLDEHVGPSREEPRR